MNHPDSPLPGDLSQLDRLGGCFEAVADALALVREALPEAQSRRGEFEESLHLLASAQSALRAAAIGWYGRNEPDQVLIFNWLRGTTSRERVLIRRHMKVDDPADPDSCPELQTRIEKLAGQFREDRERGRKRKRLLSKVRYQVSKVTQAPAEESRDEWLRLVAVVDELVQDGLPPSNVEVRELLLTVLDDMPPLEDLPKGFRLVLREIDRFLARAEPAEERGNRNPSPTLRQAAELLAGRAVVLIGGERRSQAEEALRTGLGLSELIWIATREHQSLEPFEPYIARSEVALVLLAIRWSSHSHGDVETFCRLQGKPLVRLPTGYSPNQVAYQILEQCGDRLGRRTPQQPGTEGLPTP
jgi:hypothetical protein